MTQPPHIGDANGEATKESDIAGKPAEPRPIPGNDLAKAAGGGGNATGEGRSGDDSTLAGADAHGHQGDDDMGRGAD